MIYITPKTEVLRDIHGFFSKNGKDLALSLVCFTNMEEKQVK